MKPFDWKSLPTTTAIGSLPHHNIDAALEFSFRLGVPFLPQIPIRNPWEFMIAQALEGIPGIEPSADGAPTLDQDVWIGRARRFDEKLAAAFADERDPSAFEPFEPSAPTSSGWQPFLWECEEREVQAAKVQLAGPITAQAALRLKNGSSVSTLDGLNTQVLRLVLARALAMSRRIQQVGIAPLVYLDEPGLFGVRADQPRHVLALQELRLMIQTLKRDGAIVGLHCCSNTDWNAILPLGLDLLSIDAGLSLESLLGEAGPALRAYLAGGGRLSLGAIPTGKSDSGSTRSLDPKRLLDRMRERFLGTGGFTATETRNILHDSILTPACGLALHTPSEAENILEALLDLNRRVRADA